MSEAVEPPKLFSGDVDGAAASTSAVNGKSAAPTVDDVPEFFELERCAGWIREGGYTKIALQFPDKYLPRSAQVAQLLESATLSKIYILGDTSYGSCCVDYITAEHAACDALIHFGDACASATVGRLPTLYIYGRRRVEPAELERELRRHADTATGAEGRVGLLFDSEFAGQADDLIAVVRHVFADAEVFTLTETDAVDSDDNNNVDSGTEVTLRRRVPQAVRQWADGALIFVGGASSALLPIWLMTFADRFAVVLHYAPERQTVAVERPATSRLLRKRLYLIERLRDASNIGLVVGTLAVRGFRDAIVRTRRLCRAAGKRLYVFSIGKINEPKLSNFADHVDAFILLSCPFGVILNTGDFYKPIVSLYEAEIALNPDKNWFAADSGGWTSEFDGFLSDFIGRASAETSNVSLITGRIRVLGPAGNEEFDVTAAAADGRRMQLMQYSEGDYFANRSWKGLDDESATAVGEIRVKRGMDGVAVDYGEKSG